MRRVPFLVTVGILGSVLTTWAVLARAQQQAPPAAAPAAETYVTPTAPAAPATPVAPAAAAPQPTAEVRMLPTAPAQPAAVSETAPVQAQAPAAAPVQQPVAEVRPAATPVAQPAATAAQQPAAEPKAAPASAQAPGTAEPQAEMTPSQLEASVTLAWAGPSLVKVGRPADYTLTVRNICAATLQQVQILVRIPQGTSVTATEPAGQIDNKVIAWTLGTLLPKQEKVLRLRLVPDTKGITGCYAWVSFTGSSALKVTVCEPKLVLKVQAPERVMIGDPATMVLTVHNPGDGPAEQVKIQAELPEGLVNAMGRKVEYDIGNLAPGESRSVQLICSTQAGGEQKCNVVAFADDGGLKAQEQMQVNVLMPRLELEASGPKVRYLERKATYVFKVANTGDAAANNVYIRDALPEGFKFSQATDGGSYDFPTRTVSWFLGELAPGQAREVRLEVIAASIGDHHQKVSVQAARGQKVESDVPTRVEGLSELALKISDLEDPVEVGADVTYQVRIQNNGSKTETNLKLVCTVPEKMQFKGAQGSVNPHEVGKEIVFEPIAALEPHAEAVFKVTLKSLVPGDFRFKAQITGSNLTEPVVESEGTRVYQD